MVEVRFVLSYSRKDTDKVQALAERLSELGHEVWMDTRIRGGQAWWDEILRQIRGCDVFVVVVSHAVTSSEYCSTERDYAKSLGKAILPVAVDDVRYGSLPADLSQLQIVDYSSPGEKAALRLAAAISALPRSARLPDQLPPAPRVPRSLLSELADLLDTGEMDRASQLAVVSKLEDAMARAEDAGDKEVASELLQRLLNRDDLYSATERAVQRSPALAGCLASLQDPPAAAVAAGRAVGQQADQAAPSPTVVKPDGHIGDAEVKEVKTLSWRVLVRLSQEEHMIEYKNGLHEHLYIDDRVEWTPSAWALNTLSQLGSRDFVLKDGQALHALRIGGPWVRKLSGEEVEIYLDNVLLLRFNTSPSKFKKSKSKV